MQTHLGTEMRSIAMSRPRVMRSAGNGGHGCEWECRGMAERWRRRPIRCHAQILRCANLGNTTTIIVGTVVAVAIH